MRLSQAVTAHQIAPVLFISLRLTRAGNGNSYDFFHDLASQQLQDTHTHHVYWTYIAPFPVMKHHKIATWKTVYAWTIINFNETVTCKTDALTSCNCPAELIVPHGQLVLPASARGLQLDPEPLCFFLFHKCWINKCTFLSCKACLPSHSPWMYSHWNTRKV